MPSRDLENLAEAQRETVRALAVLAEQLRGSQARADKTPEREAAGDQSLRQEVVALAGSRSGLPAAGLERALEATAGAVSELGQASAANTQALGALSRELGGLPALLAGFAGGLKDGGGLLGGVLKSGLGLAPLGLKIAGLFRGRGEEAAPLSPFVEPPSLALEVGNTQDILAGFPRADRGQRQEVRVAEQQRAVLWQPQVTVNVSAMDSRSFLDRSSEIARAVREAMLHMHPVNDLISEL